MPCTHQFRGIRTRTRMHMYALGIEALRLSLNDKMIVDRREQRRVILRSVIGAVW